MRTPDWPRARDQLFEVIVRRLARSGRAVRISVLPHGRREVSDLGQHCTRGAVWAFIRQDQSTIIRAIMEGVNLTASQPQDCRGSQSRGWSALSVGGSANSRVWTQIKSDITNKPIHVPASDHATTLGAALIAGVGIGVYRDFQSAVDNTVRIQRVHEPDELAHQMYRGYYRLYLDLYDRLKDHFRQLDSLRTRRDYC